MMLLLKSYLGRIMIIGKEDCIILDMLKLFQIL